MPTLLLQVVLALSVGEGPVRFGVPVPEAAVAAGLSLRGRGTLQWRPLALRPAAGRRWIEVALCGGDGRIRIDRGGGAPSPADGGPALRAAAGAPQRRDNGDVAEWREWRWADGTVDRWERTRFAASTLVDGEVFAPGEADTALSAGLIGRSDAALAVPRRIWAEVGLLPPEGTLAAPVRAHLQRAAHALRELPGRRGAGDYERSGGIVTNLEFDTTLALLRLGLALGDVELLHRAQRSARHLVDRDLDVRSGLPFAHGPGHRDAAPEPGHAWLQGLAWTAAITADESLLAAARQIAAALAANPPTGEHGQERARDFAWPLLELEAWLTFADDPVAATAADAYAAAIAARFDAELRTFRFGEGEVAERGGGYFERGWLTGGVVVPALQAHLRRRPSAALQACVDAAVAALLARIGTGRDGLPTHWRALPGGVFAEHRATGDAKAFLLLEALPRRDLARLLRRQHVLAGLLATPALDDPDLPTSLTMIARCTWVYR